MTDAEIDEKALAWLRNYHGSIDSTALLLAYKAGRSEALDEAARKCEPYTRSEPQRCLMDDDEAVSYAKQIERDILALKFLTPD